MFFTNFSPNIPFSCKFQPAFLVARFVILLLSLIGVLYCTTVLFGLYALYVLRVAVDAAYVASSVVFFFLLDGLMRPPISPRVSVASCSLFYAGNLLCRQKREQALYTLTRALFCRWQAH